MYTLSQPLFSYKTFITDVLIIVAVYFIPALSHQVPFPLYTFEPMRLLLFAGLLLVRNNANAYFLACTIPLVSTIVSGHPPLAKAILISFELLANVWILLKLAKQYKWNAGILFFVSTVASKIIYYGLKFIFIQLSLIPGDLITTALTTQLITLIVLSVIYAVTIFILQKRQANHA
jgi:hypothetical protein